MELLDHLVLPRREEKEEKTRLKSFERETESRFQRRQALSYNASGSIALIFFSRRTTTDRRTKEASGSHALIPNLMKVQQGK